ncbi:hypothetical protein F5Y04DRAFT_9715 [Hypomontagnella monticulosa]|nr:hypothetical protein F5Y04DRAFT_9715 [Hypomontagnella monticulosa]
MPGGICETNDIIIPKHLFKQLAPLNFISSSLRLSAGQHFDPNILNFREVPAWQFHQRRIDNTSIRLLRMEFPEDQISHVIRGLTQDSRQDQFDTLEEYFLPDAYFVHPFCRVPSFNNYTIPFTDWTINSRQFVFFIYQWYRILSPEIKLDIGSTCFDKKKNLLYVTLRQTFTLWFVPLSLWQANVKLVTVLELQRLPTDREHRPLSHRQNGNGDLTLAPQPRQLYFIKGQQDHYQIEDFLKFIAPWGASFLWVIWQLFATLVCTLGVIFLRIPTIFVRERILKLDSEAIKKQ